MLLLHGGPGATHEYLEACDSYLPERRDRVLLLRPARLGLQRPARRAVAVGAGPLRRRGGAGPPGARHGRRATSCSTASPGAASWPWSTPRPPGAPARAHHLQHDGQRPGLQRVRRAGTDAGDGPGRAGGDQGAGGSGDIENPRYMELLIRAPLRPPRAADAARGVAGPGAARLRPHQPGDLHVDAGAERAGHQRGRQPRAVGPDRADSRRSRCPPWSSGPATTRWTRRTWR